MPSCSTAKNPQGVEITFNEQYHSYKSVIDGKEISYVSGTTFLSKFFKPFDPTGEITARCAKRDGLTVEQLKQKWAEKGKKSCYYGTRLHETCEDTLLQRDLRNTPDSPEEDARFKNGIKAAKSILQKFDIIGIEKIVFSHQLPTPIAGTIDLLCKSKLDGSYCIFDWKTNEKIEKDNKYNSFCLDPISYLPDTSLYHYGLQLSLYQFIMEYQHYVPNGTQFKRALIHITSDNAEVIKIPDLTKEIRDLVIYSAANSQNNRIQL